MKWIHFEASQKELDDAMSAAAAEGDESGVWAAFAQGANPTVAEASDAALASEHYRLSRLLALCAEGSVGN